MPEPTVLENILARVRILLKIEKDDDTQDELLMVYIESTIQQVLNYCNLVELPWQLYDTIARMVTLAYKEAVGGMVIEGTGAVSSITEDGRTVSFDVSSQLLGAAGARVADIFPSFITELSKFKRLYK